MSIKSGQVHIPCKRKDPSAGTFCTYREIHNEIDVSAVGAGNNDPGAVSQSATPLHEVLNVQTHARFCQNVPGPAVEFPIVYCGSPAIESDDQLVAVANAGAETFDPKHPWHRISITQGSLASVRDDAVLPSFDYGGSPGAMTWDYLGDNAFWHRSGMNFIGDSIVSNANCNDTAVFGAGTCLNGRIWLNGTSPVGITDPTAPDGTFVGLHNGATIEDYYFDIQPDATTFEFIPGVGALPRNRFILRTPGDPGIVEREGPQWQIFDRGNAIPIFANTSQVFGLRQSSALVDATASFGAAFTRELEAGLAWVNAPGPSSAGLTQPMAIAMSDDGTSIAATANLSGGQVLLGRNVELIATRSGGANGGINAAEDFGATVDIKIPATLSVRVGNAGNGNATLSFHTTASDAEANDDVTESLDGRSANHRVQCLYQGGAAESHPTSADDRALGLNYKFVSCTNGMSANDVLSATSARLQLQSSDAQAGQTTVEVAINALESNGVPFPITSRRSCREDSSSKPRARRDFVATYAPTLNGVFLLGGVSRWDESLSDVWFKPLDGPWQQVAVPSGVIGHVIDAAFSPADGRLWVLDEVDGSARNIGKWCGHGRPTVRLLRIERETGGLRVVASATPRNRYDRRGLLVDRDGQILIYASSNATDTHSVTRLVPDSNEFNAFLASNLPRAIVSTPVVDYQGYSFVEQPPRGSPHAFALDRSTTLPFAPATVDAWTQLLQ